VENKTSVPTQPNPPSLPLAPESTTVPSRESPSVSSDAGVLLKGGMFMGAISLLFGIGWAITYAVDASTPKSQFWIPDDPADLLEQKLAIVGLLSAGLLLFGGGVFVLVAERKARKKVSAPPEPKNLEKEHSPKWPYIIAGCCWLGCFVAALVGLNLGQQPGAFFARGAMVGAIVGPGGLIPASICLTISRSKSLSVPRRIYASVLFAGFSFFFAVAFGSEFSH
jgi:hypothetical protein